MSEHDIYPPDMLPIDYIGIFLGLAGVAIALAAAVLHDPWMMFGAAGVLGIGTVLKVKGTRDKARLDREHAAARERDRGGSSVRRIEP